MARTAKGTAHMGAKAKPVEKKEPVATPMEAKEVPPAGVEKPVTEKQPVAEVIFEKCTVDTLPDPSANTRGRVVFTTDTLDMYVDGGGFWLKASQDFFEYEDNKSWDGKTKEVIYTVDGSALPYCGRVTDARKCMWQVKQNDDSHKVRNEAIIDHPTSNTVRVAFMEAPAKGTYRIIGVG